jgi:predicted transposase YbfD/YdcC
MYDTPPQTQSLLFFLGQVKDPRKTQGLIYPLPLILIIAIMSIMSGYEGERAKGDFVARNYKEILELLPELIPDQTIVRLPSYQTIDRVISDLDFASLNTALINWSRQFLKEREVIHLDGKAVKGTLEAYHSSEQRFINLVTAITSATRQAIGSNLVDNSKASEIPKLRDLVRILGLREVIFTADALHCQKETIQMIIETGNSFVLQVKGNQKKLKRQLEINCQGLPQQVHQQTERNRGRIETRICKVFSDTMDISLDDWPIRTLLKVERATTQANGDKTEETAYFISNLDSSRTTAQEFNQIVRQHWSIEAFHYVKDVTFLEDKCKQRAKQSPQILALLRTICIDVFRRCGYANMAQAIRLLSNDIQGLYSMLNQT